jgi:hypothetical protein
MKKAILYFHNKGMNVTQIAEKLKVSRTTIHTKAQSLNINLKIEEKRAVVYGRIIKKLVRRGYVDNEIAIFLKISRKYVNEIRNELNIKYPESTLSKKEKAVLVGTLLGDAYINTLGNTSRLQLHHSTKQEDYCRWKSKMLPSLKFNYRYNSNYNKTTNKNYQSVKYTSGRVKCLNEFSYTKKGIPLEWLAYYNDLSLAIHFMDDGMKTGNAVKLCTHSFTKEDLKKYVEFCFKKFKILWTINKDNSLYLPTKYISILKKIVKPFIHSSLMYKLD